MTSSTSKKHLLITGTGRSGTTLLVELLEHLGLDTRVDHSRVDDVANAGLEWSLTDDDPPYVVKNPKASLRLRTWIESGRVDADQLDAVIIPVRDLAQAAGSRAEVSFSRRRMGPPGGLSGVRWARNQDLELGRQLAELILTLAEYEIPHILLAFPKFARDPEYCLRVLRPVVPEIADDQFLVAWNAVVQPGLIHDYDPSGPGLMKSTSLFARDGLRRVRRRIGHDDNGA